MDFIEWCADSSDRLRDWILNQDGDLYHHFSFRDFREVNFTDSVSNTEELEVAVRQAFSTLVALHLAEPVWDLSSNMPDFETQEYQLTKKGRDGSISLLDFAQFQYAEELDDLQLEMIKLVNSSSHVKRSHFALLVPVSRSFIKDRFSRGHSESIMNEMLGIVEDGGVRFYGNHQCPFLQIGIEISSTFDSIVVDERESEVADAFEAFGRQLGSAMTEPMEIDFGFIEDEELRELLEADWGEANICVDAFSYKAAVILYAGVLEGLLIWLFRDSSYSTRQNVTEALNNYSQSGRSKGSIQWSRMNLSDLYRLCRTSEFLDEKRLPLLESVREFRDSVHPENQRGIPSPTKGESQTIKGVVEMVAGRIRATVGQDC